MSIRLDLLLLRRKGEIELKISNLDGVQVKLMLAGIMCMLLHLIVNLIKYSCLGRYSLLLAMFTPYIGMILFGIGLFTTCKSDSDKNDESDKKENEEDF